MSGERVIRNLLDYWQDHLTATGRLAERREMRSYPGRGYESHLLELYAKLES